MIKRLPVCWNSKINSTAESLYSSELGKVTAEIWALNDTTSIWRGATLNTCSDSKDIILTFQNIQRITDNRVLGRVDYLLEIPQLTVQFTPGKFNKIGDMFSRCHDKIFHINNTQELKIPEELWRNIHRGHFGLDKHGIVFKGYQDSIFRRTMWLSA